MRHERISTDPGIKMGKPCIRNTRIPVEHILYELGSRISVTEVLELYPTLTDQDIEAAINYAADLVRQNWLLTKTIALADADDHIPR